MTIKRDRDRVKKTGEVFTPEWLVDEMLMKLCEQDETLFTDPDKTFLEPACGDGNFLVRILHFKIEFFQAANPDVEVPIERILQSIYGIDIMSDNVRHARERMMQVVKDKLNITDPKKIKTLETILYGRDATHKDEGVYGNIVKANGLEWDYDNWCPQGSTSKIEHDTEGTISIKSVVKETTDDETLAAMSTKSKPKKKKVEINTDGDDFFS